MAMGAVNEDISTMPCLEIDKASTDRSQERPLRAGTSFAMCQASGFESWERSLAAPPGQASM